MMRQFVEHRLDKQRRAEHRSSSMRKMLVENNILAGHGRSELHVEHVRRQREHAAERVELVHEYGYVQGEQERRRQHAVTEAEEKLAKALAEKKAESHREVMNKKRICDTSEELRVLKEKLHAAKVNKERAMQLQQQHVQRDRGLFMDHKIAEYMENERLECQELEHKLLIEKQAQRERVKHINQQQIAQKEAQREMALKEYIKEKDQVADLVRRIDLEDMQEAESRARKRHETKETLARFTQEQKARQLELEDQERQVQLKCEEYARQKALREEQLAKQAEDEAKEKERILKIQIGQMEAKKKVKGEMEQLRNDLHQEEHEAEFRQREALSARKKGEQRENMKLAYLSQMQSQEENKLRAMQEEDRVRGDLLAKFAEDDRIEAMTSARRRQKVHEHKREADRLIYIRRNDYREARQKELDEQERLRREERERQAVVEEERRRLLAEHAVELQDFLPKGTFGSREDYRRVFPSDAEFSQLVPACA